MGLVMHPATSASCVPLTVPVSSIGIVLITVASLAVLMVVTGEVVVVFETAFDVGRKTVVFPRGGGPSRRPSVLRVGLGVCPCSPHAGRFQRAVYRFCSRPLCFVP